MWSWFAVFQCTVLSLSLYEQMTSIWLNNKHNTCSLHCADWLVSNRITLHFTVWTYNDLDSTILTDTWYFTDDLCPLLFFLSLQLNLPSILNSNHLSTTHSFFLSLLPTFFFSFFLYYLLSFFPAFFLSISLGAAVVESSGSRGSNRNRRWPEVHITANNSSKSNNGYGQMLPLLVWLRVVWFHLSLSASYCQDLSWSWGMASVRSMQIYSTSRHTIPYYITAHPIT